MTAQAAPPRPQRSVSRGARAGQHGPVAWMALPALAMFLCFAVLPLLGVVALSFTRWDGLGAIHPAGIANWRSVLGGSSLPHSLWVTFEVMLYSWLVQTPISLLLGVYIAGRHRNRALLAVLYFIPLLLSAAAIAVTFKALLDPNFGLGPGLHSGLLTQNWLGEPALAMGVIIFIVSWQFIPFHSLIYQGAVRQIPESMYEAAALDGAGKVRTFWSVTLPQLKYTIITSSTLMVVGSLTFFDLIFVLTGGGPGDSTRVLALEMYRRGFGANQMGPASVIAVILVLVGLVIAVGLRGLGGDADESQLEGV
jgi:raffinose/stachyose/melibiose transport system permease protein